MADKKVFRKGGQALPLAQGMTAAQTVPTMQQPTMQQPMPPTAQPMQAEQSGAGLSLMDKVRATKLTEQDVLKALETLRKYKAGKSSVERRVISSQQWWKLRNWEEMEKRDGGRVSGTTTSKPNSAWLWNCIVGKHADAMAAFPEPVVLPRMQDDQAVAQKLSDIVPVVMAQNDFEEVYSDCTWQKMLEGTGIFGVFWDKSRNGGLGDVAITRVDVLNLFWEAGVEDIQKSPNLFLCTLMNNDQIESQWPQMRGKTKGSSLTLNKYIYDDNVDTSDKSLLIDWYYKRPDPSGRTVLHYAKLCGSNVLFSSEDDPQMAQAGVYDDGLYPFVFDRLFPVQGSPCGYGYIDVGHYTQETIDGLNTALTSNAKMTATPRFFVRKDGSVNEEEFADWSKPFVHVDGNMGEDSLRQIIVGGMNSYVMEQLQASIEELKFVTGNTDVSNGSTSAGVTAASAIAALQETAGRSSKDSSKSAYRAYARLVTMVIERIRQFYDMPRTFRILGQMGQPQFVQMGNDEIKLQAQGIDFGVDMGYRLPVFDIDVRAQKENPYSRLSQNELALQFYQLGFFNPQMTDQSLIAMGMMDFKGKDDLMQKVQQLGTMQQMLMQFQGIALELAGRYEPELAQQLSQIVMGQAGVQPTVAAKAQEGGKNGEDSRSENILNKSRERVQNATTPQ